MTSATPLRHPVVAVGLTLAALGAACSGDRAAPDAAGGGFEIATTPTSSSVASGGSTPPSTTDGATTAPTTAPPSAAPSVGHPAVRVVPVTRFSRPVDLAIRPGDQAVHVVNQDGTVVRYDPTSNRGMITLDLSDRISSRGEQGLLGLEFSPAGDLAYVNFTDTDGDTVVAEYAVDRDGVLDTTTERTVLTVDQPYPNHNAGDLAFGPDGFLYIALGDGGSGGDPERRASDPSQLLGSLLRIDPTPNGDVPYAIPPDNPFADGPVDGVEGAPEVWAWGLRNPWKIAFDPPTGRLWIPDVGQNRFEEINVVGPTGDDRPAGWAADFGWSAFEGTERFNDDVADTGGLTFPVLTYEHGDDGCSVSGGAVYRGSAIADLEPAFVFSDFCSGILWAYDLDGARVLTLLDGLQSVTAVRAGPDGELYVLQGTGELLRLAPD